jgi:hypothetical protein
MKHLMYLFMLLISLSGCGQQTSQTQQSIQTQPKEKTDTVPTLSDLDKNDHAAWLAWKKIDSAWTAEVFWDCLKAQKLKMDCGHCTSILIKIDMQIDNSGKLVQYRVVYQHVGGGDFTKSMEDCFMEYFLQLTFPPALRNHIFRAELGRTLMC